MTVISEDFFHLVQKKIAEVRDVAMVGTVKQPDYTQVQNRATLIFTLECVLEAHRKQFATLGSPLKGKAALEHLILQKYKWSLNEIRNLSLQDAIFVLQEELAFDRLPELAQKVITLYGAQRAKLVYPDILEDEWDPNLSDKLQHSPHW
ncbi:ECs1072 family phage-associated protein [Serratia marcescens]